MKVTKKENLTLYGAPLEISQATTAQPSITFHMSNDNKNEVLKFTGDKLYLYGKKVEVNNPEVIDGFAAWFKTMGYETRFGHLVSSVEKWAHDKGIIHGGTTMGQAIKTIEEAQEIADAIKNDDREEIIDGIGDTLVTLIIQAKMQGLNLLDCLESAYNVIAKRTGKIENGQFVKDE